MLNILKEQTNDNRLFKIINSIHLKRIQTLYMYTTVI